MDFTILQSSDRDFLKYFLMKDTMPFLSICEILGTRHIFVILKKEKERNLFGPIEIQENIELIL